MPRFYFHVYDGVNLLDHEGMELQDLNAAQVLALQYAGEVLHNDAPHIRVGQNWCMEVTNEMGITLLRLNLSIGRSPEGEAIAEGNGEPTSTEARAC